MACLRQKLNFLKRSKFDRRKKFLKLDIDIKLFGDAVLHTPMCTQCSTNELYD